MDVLTLNSYLWYLIGFIRWYKCIGILLRLFYQDEQKGQLFPKTRDIKGFWYSNENIDITTQHKMRKWQINLGLMPGLARDVVVGKYKNIVCNFIVVVARFVLYATQTGLMKDSVTMYTFKQSPKYLWYLSRVGIQIFFAK